MGDRNSTRTAAMTTMTFRRLATAVLLFAAIPSSMADEPVPTEAVRILPPDADDGIDQTPYLANGTYRTEAGVVAPLPAPSDEEPPADDGGVPGMKLH
jgi:hypothetical protein